MYNQVVVLTTSSVVAKIRTPDLPHARQKTIPVNHRFNILLNLSKKSKHMNKKQNFPDGEKGKKTQGIRSEYLVFFLLHVILSLPDVLGEN